MIIVLKKNHSEKIRENLLQVIQNMGGRPQLVPAGDTLSIVLGPEILVGPRIDFSTYECVSQVISTKAEYKKVARDSVDIKKSISIGSYEFGEGQFLVIAGPCAVESEEQFLQAALKIKKAGAHILRGGAYKPRTSPYQFQGLGEYGLSILAKARELTGLPVVTEVLDVRDVEKISDYADVLQIGTRNMQNFALLKEVGKTNIPVLLKRGMSATLQEWLLAAEYIAEAGNSKILLCERGIRSFDSETRNVLDLSAIPILKQKTDLPLVVDPSHGTGRKEAVAPMALAALAAGAHSVMIEVHEHPEHALCDGFQALSIDQLASLIEKLKKISEVMGLQMPSNESVLSKNILSFDKNNRMLTL